MIAAHGQPPCNPHWIFQALKSIEPDKIVKHRSNFFLLAIICAIAFSSCAAPPTKPVEINMALVDIPTPARQQATSIAQVSPTATYIPITNFVQTSLWSPSYVTETLWGTPPASLTGLLVSDANTSNVKLEVGEQNAISQWIYALVTPFPSTIQNVSFNDLHSSWQGQAAGPYQGQPLLMDQNTSEMLTALWGPASSASVNVIAKNELRDYAWAHQPSWAIVPFESLEPRWKVLSVDGLSPTRKDFAPENYGLKIPISLNGDPKSIEQIKNTVQIPSTNRDPGKLTVIAMTGVTALVRATAYEMEKHGIAYPDQDIRQWLLDADITHISNEVPFAVDCPFPNPNQVGVKFCSRDSYIQLLEDVGTDVVELTGDHFQDWGTDAMFHTLDLYRERGWSYYGGGDSLADGQKALLMEHNGNRIAFIGCNAKGGSFAQADETNPGAVACNMDWMAQEISRLQQEGYLVIATFQHQEYYTYSAEPDQLRDFRQMAEAGAVIVSGSQAHQPQSMEFLNGAFIHYGLGNLFFDQYGLCPACSQGLIDHHVFYDGRYISTELLPIQFIDYARSRPMTDEEANSLFHALFQASGW